MAGTDLKPSIALIVLALGLVVTTTTWAESSLVEKAGSMLAEQPGKAMDGSDAVQTLAGVAENALAADSPSLVDSLVGRLGVSQEQAAGGAGSLFRFASQELGADGFQSIANAVPNMDSLLGAVPQSGALGGLAGAIGGDSVGGLIGAASVLNNFKQLGLSPDMVGQFVPVVIEYVKNQGGAAAGNLLMGALSGL